jgi:hypothetical protein
MILDHDVRGLVLAPDVGMEVGGEEARSAGGVDQQLGIRTHVEALLAEEALSHPRAVRAIVEARGVAIGVIGDRLAADRKRGMGAWIGYYLDESVSSGCQVITVLIHQGCWFGSMQQFLTIWLDHRTLPKILNDCFSHFPKLTICKVATW